jgi:hypothetical protein
MGNCTCVGSPTSCTIPRDIFPAHPCVAVWASTLPGGDIAAADINLGENATRVSVRLSELVGTSGAAHKYALKEVWSAEQMGVFDGAHGAFEAALRPHASKLYLLTKQSPKHATLTSTLPPKHAALTSTLPPKQAVTTTSPPEHAAALADERTLLDVYESHDCSGTPNATIDLTAASAAYAHCTHCFDRCAHPGDVRSMRLRGKPATAAINSNCIGKYQYAGGWTDSAFGGTLSTEGGCHAGGAGGVVLCGAGTAQQMDDDLNVICGHPTPPPANHTWPTRPFHVLDPAQYAHLLQDDAAWAARSVPYVDVPDDEMMRAFYYRWRVLRKHVRYTQDDGFVITEFLPYVPWSGTHNTIPAAAGHHIMEARWLHDLSVADDYIRLWTSQRGDPFSYSSWIGHAAWERLKLIGPNHAGNASAAAAALASIYDEKAKRYRRVTGRGVPCWYQDDGHDAMEVSVSGSGCRPTMASIMYAEAMAVARFARLGGNSLATAYEAHAAQTRDMLLSLHWNADIASFATVPLAHTAAVHGAPPTPHHSAASPSSASASSASAASASSASSSAAASASSAAASVATSSSNCNLTAVRVPDMPVNVRELLGFIPYYFEGLVPAGNSTYRAQFAALFDAAGFASPWGLRTTELRHACYNYSWGASLCFSILGPLWVALSLSLSVGCRLAPRPRVSVGCSLPAAHPLTTRIEPHASAEHGDCWNGPSWPYETARVLTGAANTIVAADAAKTDAPLTKEQYFDMLTSYVRQHTRSVAVNDTASPLGSGHVFENLHPDLGCTYGADHLGLWPRRCSHRGRVCSTLARADWNNRARMYWRCARALRRSQSRWLARRPRVRPGACAVGHQRATRATTTCTRHFVTSCSKG